MYASGVRTGMVVTAVAHRLILRVQVVAMAEWCVVVAGIMAQRVVVYLIAQVQALASVTTTVDSASFCLPSNRLKASLLIRCTSEQIYLRRNCYFICKIFGGSQKTLYLCGLYARSAYADTYLLFINNLTSDCIAKFLNGKH